MSKLKPPALNPCTFHILQLQISIKTPQVSLTVIYLIIQVVVLTRVGHQWSHHCGCFIHMKLLQGGLLWLEGCPPVA